MHIFIAALLAFQGIEAVKAQNGDGKFSVQNSKWFYDIDEAANPFHVK